MNITTNRNELNRIFDNNNSNNDDDYNNLNWPVVFLLIFSVIGIIGNLLVCMAICLYKKLQNVTNHYLVSLAIADLLVSFIVIPFAVFQSLLSKLYRGKKSYS
jgi:hypothetical protein